MQPNFPSWQTVPGPQFHPSGAQVVPQAVILQPPTQQQPPFIGMPQLVQSTAQFGPSTPVLTVASPQHGMPPPPPQQQQQQPHAVLGSPHVIGHWGDLYMVAVPPGFTLQQTQLPPQPQLLHPQPAVTPFYAPTPGLEVRGSPWMSPQSLPPAPSIPQSKPLDPLLREELARQELDVADKKPFRFKMLPPPLPIDRFITHWRVNGPRPQMGPSRLTSQEAVEESRRLITVENTVDECHNEEMLIAYEQLHTRWYNHLLVIQRKPEVQTRLRLRRECPSRQQSLEALRGGGSPTAPAPSRFEELKKWSDDCLEWWQEASRKKARRGKKSGRRERAKARNLAQAQEASSDDLNDTTDAMLSRARFIQDDSDESDEY